MSALVARGPRPMGFAVSVSPLLVLFCCFFFPPDDLIQLTAMCWMREFIQLAGRVMLPYSSGILTAVLPCLSYDDRKKSILVPELLPEAARSPAESQSLPRPRGCEGRWGWGRGCGGSSAHAWDCVFLTLPPLRHQRGGKRVQPEPDEARHPGGR